MARPKKADSRDMLRILNSYWETHADPNKLKCSQLEEYAAVLGFDIKAYDFRRDESVRNRIMELKTSVASSFTALAYKNLDIDMLIAENATKTALKTALTKLDAYWRDIYRQAAVTACENTKLLTDNAAFRKTLGEITAGRDTAVSDVNRLGAENKSLVLENRYLRSALARYLYPAIANEILYREGVLKQTDTQVTGVAMTELAEHAGNATPLSLIEAVKDDVQALTREQTLLERMKQQISGGSHGG
jgi:regulator of replication initiation timing